MKKYGITILALLILSSILPVFAAASEQQGTVKVGYVFLDQTGNQAVNQGTSNIYEGVALSLHNYSALFDNGMRFNADMTNITLKNRNLWFSAGRSGHGGIEFRHKAYRRIYDFEGEKETHRYTTNGRIWWQAHPLVRLYGDIATTKRSGQSIQLFEPESAIGLDNIDYSDVMYGIGATVQKNRTLGSLEFRGSSFSDNESTLNDRTTQRMKASFSTQCRFYTKMSWYAGYQYYRLKIKDRSDTLSANTFWGGARLYYNSGFNFRYSFIFDRADRTGDLVATDNISQALYAGKTWRGFGGITVGYQYRVVDDLREQRSGNSWSASGWYKVIPDLTIRAGFGLQTLDVDDGRSLTGRRDRDRAWGSARYAFDQGWLRLKLVGHQTDYDDIGSSADYLKGSADGSFEMAQYGIISAAYSYYKGDYTNSSGRFIFADHTLSGDLLTREYQHARLGFGGTYWRSRKDKDIESFSVRFTGLYSFDNGIGIEATYMSHNFDNLGDPSPVYTDYYTDNIVEVSVSYSLK